MSFFRFPGGKSKLKKYIFDKISSECGIKYYREPFFGGGSIGLDFISRKKMDKIWINDKDFPLSCLWNSVINNKSILKYFVREFNPSVDKFFEYKEHLLNNPVAKIGSYESVKIGFEKLAIHQISYSGLGVKSGSPLGGKEQNSKYKIDCRWSPQHICKKIDEYNKLFSNQKIHKGICTSYDFEYVIKYNKNKSIIYLDPPYFIKGSELYQYSFNVDDHIRLCDLLKKTKHYWVLSYDDCCEVRDLYSWAKIQECVVTYSINGAVDKNELIICQK